MFIHDKKISVMQIIYQLMPRCSHAACLTAFVACVCLYAGTDVTFLEGIRVMFRAY
jgi:hypothetical protein